MEEVSRTERQHWWIRAGKTALREKGSDLKFPRVSSVHPAEGGWVERLAVDFAGLDIAPPTRPSM